MSIFKSYTRVLHRLQEFVGRDGHSSGKDQHSSDGSTTKYEIGVVEDG